MVFRLLFYYRDDCEISRDSHPQDKGTPPRPPRSRRQCLTDRCRSRLVPSSSRRSLRPQTTGGRNPTADESRRLPTTSPPDDWRRPPMTSPPDDWRRRGSYTFEIRQFKVVSAVFRERIQGYFSDKKHKNHGTTTPAIGLVRSLRDHHCMMRHLGSRYLRILTRY